MTKLNGFFQNKTTMLVEAGVLVVAAVGLLIGGLDSDGMERLLKIAGAIASFADGALTSFAALSDGKKNEV